MSKRTEAISAIALQVVIAGGIGAVPAPGLETFKHIPLSANEIALCMRIARIYGQDLTDSEVKDLLIQMGIGGAAGAGLAYGATKLGHAAVDELLNFIPIVGPGIKATLAGSITAAVGWAFMEFCERTFGN